MIAQFVRNLSHEELDSICKAAMLEKGEWRVGWTAEVDAQIPKYVMSNGIWNPVGSDEMLQLTMLCRMIVKADNLHDFVRVTIPRANITVDVPSHQMGYRDTLKCAILKAAIQYGRWGVNRL